ncbi:MAG: triphosphoribosyl-dephospho-CoA synthase [Paludisphaera borealis]|uniref:triphosphoribosyl-dephospho-CoA synthase n=1 Tax=Paludisphaera borealis TaxID=1387353 RepID=UPI00284464A6|nr:triphosphoribosyl-dephospho-CoA synthase [Paludisphaera borealis]MDR3621011.1 triphosphoribosyl-dephospho-CoA synthase [Paludisphaera borealis]
MKSTLSPGKLAQIACILEATARKPGNVHRFLDFDDLDYLDFILSAAAVADPLDRARTEGVGASVLAAVEATKRVVATNSNLGMILLLAPLAAVPPDESLGEGVGRVLDATTVDDARHVYRAIRLANPGGLGEAAEQDVADEPTITLREAMTLAADRDLIARQYADGFAEVLDEGLPALRRRIEDGQPLETAIIGVFLDVLSRHPDSLIARKAGRERAAEASRRAGEVLAAGWPDEAVGRSLLGDLDTMLRSDGHRLNPGATADLTAAVLFAALRDGTIELPRPTGLAGWSGDRDRRLT